MLYTEVQNSRAHNEKAIHCKEFARGSLINHSSFWEPSHCLMIAHTNLIGSDPIATEYRNLHNFSDNINSNASSKHSTESILYEPMVHDKLFTATDIFIW